MAGLFFGLYRLHKYSFSKRTIAEELMQNPSRTIAMAALGCLGVAAWLATELITASFEANRVAFAAQATLPSIFAATGLVLGALWLISERLDK
jgi:hypothetical protein